MDKSNQGIRISNLRVEDESTIKGDFVLDLSETITKVANQIVDSDITENEYYEKMPELLKQIDSNLTRISQKQEKTKVLSTELDDLLVELEVKAS